MAIFRQLPAGCSALKRSCSGRDGFTVAVQVRRMLRQSHLPMKFTAADPLIGTEVSWAVQRALLLLAT